MGMFRRSAFALLIVAAVAALTVSVLAGARATLILTSGERVSGILSDMGGTDFTLNMGSPNESRIPIGNVAVIDFVGGGQGIPTTETSKIQPGRTLVLQRGGDSFFGRLIDVRGDNPLVLVFTTQDGQLELNASDVARVFLRRWEGMPQPDAQKIELPTPAPAPAPIPAPVPAPVPTPAPVPPPAPDPDAISIPADRGWVSTGIQIRYGQLVSFATVGEVLLSGDPDDLAGPSGARNLRMAGRGAPVPGMTAGALVGRIGVSAPFGIGGQSQALAMPGSGSLLLAVNDETPGDNRGEFRVRITIVR
jgi:hypothetical protein